jgi:hypothetical protein
MEYAYGHLLEIGPSGQAAQYASRTTRLTKTLTATCFCRSASVVL